MFYKNSLSKKSTQVHLFRFETLLHVDYKRVMGGCEVGVLCRGSTPEVHSAGKHIREVVFLGCQWFRVSNGSGKTFGVHG